jgi:hypothetical protein
MPLTYDKKHLLVKEITMSKRLSLVIFMLTCGLITLTSSVHAEQNAVIHMAAGTESGNSEHNTSHLLSPPTSLIVRSELDNAEHNVRDKNNTMLRPKDPKETKIDIKTTSKIPQAVVRDKALFVAAQHANKAP